MIFAELLIIGLEGGICFSFFLLSIFGVDIFEQTLSFLEKWQLLVLAIVLALIYVFGVILDRIADWLFRSKEKQVDEEIVGDMPVTIPVMRFSLGIQNDFLNQQLEYTRTRMRIVRASTINFPLIAVGLSTFLLTRLTNISYELRWNYVGIVLAMGFVFSYASYRTWKSLIKAHLKLAKVMYEHQTQHGKKKKTTKKS